LQGKAPRSRLSVGLIDYSASDHQKEQKMKAVIIAAQAGAAITALLAAWFWFQAAQGKAPPATYDQIDQLKPWLDQASHLNRVAATWAGVSALLAAITTALNVWF
jgi:hypothetical protein